MSEGRRIHGSTPSHNMQRRRGLLNGWFLVRCVILQLTVPQLKIAAAKEDSNCGRERGTAMVESGPVDLLASPQVKRGELTMTTDSAAIQRMGIRRLAPSSSSSSSLALLEATAAGLRTA